MSRQCGAHVLDAEVALDQRLTQVSKGSNDRTDNAQDERVCS